MKTRSQRTGTAALLSLACALLLPATLPAEPTVVKTFEGQSGETPDPLDKLAGGRVIKIPGAAGDLLTGELFVHDDLGAPPPPELVFVTTDFHTGAPMPVTIARELYNHSADVVHKPQAVHEWLGPGDDIAGVFAHVEDGTDPSTEAVVLAIVPGLPGAIDLIVLDNIPTTPFPDDTFQDVDIAVDDQGRITLVFTEDADPTPAIVPKVKGKRFDGVTGSPIDEFEIDDVFNAEIAILQPNGERMVVSSSNGANIFGNIIDLSGPTPTVLPEFSISTTPGFANINPSVAADIDTGAFVVTWENLTAVQGDPVNIRARFFDAAGNPIGDDFEVNTSTDDAQGQPVIAIGPDGEAVIVWASDPVLPGQDQLDVFFQVYDASGSPIGGETRANGSTSGIQDRPYVAFLPEPDAQGRPQFIVNWRDVGQPDGSHANGTGNGYSCHSIDEPQPIFANGFEDGDTSSWSRTKQ